MVKEHSLGLMDSCMKENGRMDLQMVNEHTLTLMESSMLGSSRMGEIGTPLNTTKTETSQESM